jgi:OHCU decarboxylase
MKMERDMRLEDLNALDEEAAARAFLRCCGSSRWARQMAAARPFAGAEALADAADAIWSPLDRADWLEAFAAHPRIGETRADRVDRPGGTGRAATAGGAGRADEVDRPGGAGESAGSGSGEPDWSLQEQARVADAADQGLRRLVEANRDYEARFGYIFIVCATGKTAEEVLALLDQRVRHDPGEELRIAAEEQRKITQLRLKKLLERKADVTP